MTNKYIVKNWKKLGIQFKSNKKIIPLTDMFLICPGEGMINIDGGEEPVVFFYQGYDEKGSPAAMFKSNKKDDCYTFAMNSKKQTHVRCFIGKFVKVKEKK